MSRLGGRRALVTGAGSGIGRACAVRLAADGAAVAVVDVRAGAAEDAAGEIVAAGGRAVFLAADVSDDAAVAGAVADAAEALGGLDTLVLSAGILISRPFEEMSVADWDRTIAVNLRGMFLPIHHALPLLLLAAGRSSVVTIGSVASLVAGGASVAYDASKGGVLQLTRGLAGGLADRGPRANCVLPGVVSTGLQANSDELTNGRAAGASAPLRVRVPIEGAAQPGEIAGAVAWLCSDEASFVTGAAIPVDGGFTAV